MKTILFVEDDQLLASMYQRKLETAGYAVDYVHTAEEGIAELDQAPELIVLDILLPGKNGLWFLKELRRLGHTMPVIILTNLAEADFPMPKRLRSTLGIAKYLVKTQTTPADLLGEIVKVERTL